jgi:HK97 family phage major capsid protein
MKTITQYREDIKNLMQSAADIDAKCVNEDRDPTESELTLKNEIMDTVEEYEKIVTSMERQEKLHNKMKKPQESLTRPDNIEKTSIKTVDLRSKDTFKSFGEQLASVINAVRPGGKIDPRLYNAAASGLSETIASDGGFLVQSDFTNELLQDVFTTGVLASKCRRQPISGTSNGIKINGVDETSRASTRYGGILGYWLDEAGEKTETKPKFRQIELSLKKLIGLCYTTDELLQDAAALESFIKGAFAGEFGYLIDDAIIRGTGAGQPLGILNAGCLVTQTAETGQDPDTVVTENIVNMYSRRFAAQTQNYAWYYNQNIEPQLFTMSLAVGAGGSAVYMPPGGLSDAPYGRILGLPAIAIEQASTLGDLGDIILANFKDGYILAEKGGIQSAMSIHVRFVYDESLFRFVLRIDGQPLRASALTPAQGSSTQSHFITLAAR